MTIKAARVNKGYTQAVAAKMLGISVYSLSCYERGVTQPNVKTAANMSKVYGVPIQELIFSAEKND